MRSLTLGVLLVMAMAAPALGYSGALSLYTSMSISDCDKASTMFMTDTILLVYVRGDGPEMGKAAQFMLQKSSDMVLFTPTPTWNSLITLPMGDIETGIAVTAATCLGDYDVVYIGSIYIFNMGEFGTFTVKVVADPGAEPPGIYITVCDPAETRYSVLGGTFIFNGTCNPAVEESSWGAIKSMYR